MAIELPDARALSDEALQLLRLRALRGIELGYSEVELADLLGTANALQLSYDTGVRSRG